MTGYQPLKITGPTTGLVQNRQNFLLPEDGFPVLENALIFRERIQRKRGNTIIGRLGKVVADFFLGNMTVGTPSTFSYNFLTAILAGDPTVSIIPGSVNITVFVIPGQDYFYKDINNDSHLINTNLIGSGYSNYITSIILGTTTQVFISPVLLYVAGDQIYISGINGTVELNNTYQTILSVGVNYLILSVNSTLFTPYISGGSIQFVGGTINYITGVLSLEMNTVFSGGTVSGSFNYALNLPTMGILGRELNGTSVKDTVFFDTKYAYEYDPTINAFKEFPNTGISNVWTGDDFNFFWGMNWWQTPPTANTKLFWVTNFVDPIRYTDGVAWTDFTPILDNAGTILNTALAMVPFRNRMLVFNTIESNAPYTQRVRWSAIGNPFTANSWNQNVRGQGNFLDLPTSESITSVAFVRDNLIIFTEHQTWQLRYTGRTIAPFVVERVNSELGCLSTFSSVQFDTSVVAVGDKGIVECDSYKSDRIDIKIPDLVFEFNQDQHGLQRVCGIRDFFTKLAFWMYPYAPDDQGYDGKFPNKRLVYNYENDSWAIFDDYFTALGQLQEDTSPTWGNTNLTWEEYEGTWISRPDLFPAIVGGNQQGYISYLDDQGANDVTLYISNITGQSPNPTKLTIKNHNLMTGAIIQVSIPGTTPYFNLNNVKFQITRLDADNLLLYIFNPLTQQFSTPQVDTPQTYFGGGQVAIVDNFTIQSKKFNFLDEGETIQMGYLDVLMNSTSGGEISLNVYVDYNNSQPTNTLPENVNPVTQLPDTTFNSIVPTFVDPYKGSSKNWIRVVCPTYGSFLTLEWTLSNDQMNRDVQSEDVQIDAQVLWIRKAGKQLPRGI